MAHIRFMPATGVAAVVLVSLMASASMAAPSSVAARPQVPAATNLVPAKFSGTFSSAPDAGSTWKGKMTWRYSNMEGPNAVFLPVSGTVAWTYTPRPGCTAEPNAGTVALNSNNGVLRLYPVEGGKRHYDVVVNLRPEQEPRVTQSCPDPSSEDGEMIVGPVTVPVGGESYILLSNAGAPTKSSAFRTDAKAKKLVGDLDHVPAAAYQHWIWNFKGTGSRNAG